MINESVAADVFMFTSVAVIGKNVDYEKLFGKYTLTPDNFDMIFLDPTAAAGLYKYSLERDSFPSVTAFDAVAADVFIILTLNIVSAE